MIGLFGDSVESNSVQDVPKNQSLCWPGSPELLSLQRSVYQEKSFHFKPAWPSFSLQARLCFNQHLARPQIEFPNIGGETEAFGKQRAGGLAVIVDPESRISIPDAEGLRAGQLGLRLSARSLIHLWETSLSPSLSLCTFKFARLVLWSITSTVGWNGCVSVWLQLRWRFALV